MKKKNTGGLIVFMTFFGYNVTVFSMSRPPAALVAELALKKDATGSEAKYAQPKQIPGMTIRHDLGSAIQSGDLSWVNALEKMFNIAYVTSGDEAWTDHAWRNSYDPSTFQTGCPIELGTRSMLWMSMHFAINYTDKRKDDRLKIVEKFLSMPGCDVNEENYFYLPKQRGFWSKKFVLIKGSLLHMATIYDRTDLMSMLIAKQCALDETTSENLTALQYALANGSHGAVALLVEAGANLDIFATGCCRRKISAENMTNNQAIRKIILAKKQKTA